jgi:hypothetical protein
MTTDTSFESQRKQCLKQQTELRAILAQKDQFAQGIAILHTAKITPAATWSFPDALLAGMDKEQIRRIPRSAEHAVACTICHQIVHLNEALKLKRKRN